MGSDYNPDRRQAFATQMQLGEQQYQLAAQALTGSTGYLMDARSRGYGIDQGSKFDAMLSDVQEATSRGVTAGGGPFGSGGVAGALGARAAGTTATEAQRGMAGLDEINKIRAALSSHGLASTGLAAQAGGLQANAFRMMPNVSPVGSYIGAGLGLASIGYKGGQQAGWWGQGLKQLQPQTQWGSWSTATPGMGSTTSSPYGTGSYFSGGPGGF